MKVSLREIRGNWDRGYALDKHVVSSVYIGDNAYGRPQFDTTRSEVGEALFQLKYRNDWSQVPLLASALATNIYPKFDGVALIVPMPPSNVRARQPVMAVTEALGDLVKRPVLEDLLVKKPNGKQSKNFCSKSEKIEALKDTLTVQDAIKKPGLWNVLIIDDLFDTGASLEAACGVLRGYPKIWKYLRRCADLEVTWMTTVFIAGSMNIKHLDREVKARIDNIVASKLRVVVGDANGADKSIQTYLFEHGVSNTVVYCSGPQPRNNVGKWRVRSIDSPHEPGSRAFFAAKDVEMAKEADYGLMIWDAKSTGTLNNIIELLRLKKKSVVFINKKKEFKTVADVSHLEELVDYMSAHARRRANEKIRLLEKIETIKHEQSEMFELHGAKRA